MKTKIDMKINPPNTNELSGFGIQNNTKSIHSNVVHGTNLSLPKHFIDGDQYANFNLFKALNLKSHRKIIGKMCFDVFMHIQNYCDHKIHYHKINIKSYERAYPCIFIHGSSHKCNIIKL